MRDFFKGLFYCAFEKGAMLKFLKKKRKEKAKKVLVTQVPDSDHKAFTFKTAKIMVLSYAHLLMSANFCFLLWGSMMDTMPSFSFKL